MDLDELIQRRRALEVDLAVHEASLRCFWPPDERPSFVIAQKELESLTAGEAHKSLHMTSSASCFESLADREPRYAGKLAPDRDDRRWATTAERFAQRTLDMKPGEWESDKAAHVYCRVRTLPAVLRFAPKLKAGSPRRNAAGDRLIEAFAIIDGDRPPAERGLGERVLNEEGKVVQSKDYELYPANAFHAYWGARANAQYLTRLRSHRDLKPLPSSHRERVAQNHAWAQAAMVRHAALLLGDKTRGDAQQLVFALLTDLLASGEQLTPASERFDLYDTALRAFFSAQEPSGRWPPSAPLFHYPQSGNAYCYMFETLTELLRPALPREEGRGLRTLLEPYLATLLAAWDYAMKIRVPLQDARGSTYGWSSHHHVTRDAPEAWATAEVFAFGQLLRCVLGHIVAERAAIELKARRPEYATPAVAEKELGSRGSTWASDRWTVGRQLSAMFLHPARVPQPDHDGDVRDPDATVIGKDDARSAVLFGPPGTGKTTLAEALAGALGWRFIEVLASDFLSAGIDAVPARADVIFDRLMQVDRCVVLFDEIDELIRDRTADTSDPFGRFLTTSMLPKLAKLWTQRRLIFFVATNHVSKADPAITRSSRFDASIFVAPPGLSVKRELLKKDLKEKAPTLDHEKVKQALDPDPTIRNGLPEHQRALAVLPLLRYDQVPELARRLRLHTSSRVVSPEALARELVNIGEDLLEHEWQPAKKPADWSHKATVDCLVTVYQEYLADQRHDFSRRRVIAVNTSVKHLVPRTWKKLRRPKDTGYTKDTIFYESPSELPGEMDGDSGDLMLTGPAQPQPAPAPAPKPETAVDWGILAFDCQPSRVNSRQP